MAGAAGAENPQSLIQRAVNSERTANQNDYSNWLYHEGVKKPKGGVVQWVAATQHGDVHRVYQRNGQRVPDSKQRDAVQEFLRDAHAQKKSVEEDAHDAKEIDDFLKLLPVAFIWTETSAARSTRRCISSPIRSSIRQRARPRSSAAWWRSRRRQPAVTHPEHGWPSRPRGDLRRRPAGEAKRGKLVRSGAGTDRAFTLKAYRAACPFGRECAAL